MNRREMIGMMGAAGVGLTMGGPLASAAEHGAGGKHHNPFAAGWDADKGEFVLPPLPYAYDALEPSIDEATMRIHHTAHHAGYVRGLNSALKQLHAAREADDFSAIRSLSRSVSFNGGGHTLHTLFWSNMAPPDQGGGGEPQGALLQHIERSFGSVDRMKAQFTAAASAVEGAGWGICGVDQVSGHLVIIQGENQQKLTTWGLIPVLVLDVWEHAYYLKYQNRRSDYVKAFWNVVNWPEVARRVEAFAV